MPPLLFRCCLPAEQAAVSCELKCCVAYATGGRRSSRGGSQGCGGTRPYELVDGVPGCHRRARRMAPLLKAHVTWTICEGGGPYRHVTLFLSTARPAGCSCRRSCSAACDAPPPGPSVIKRLGRAMCHTGEAPSLSTAAAVSVLPLLAGLCAPALPRTTTRRSPSRQTLPRAQPHPHSFLIHTPSTPA